jgi:hypothetical protein
LPTSRAQTAAPQFVYATDPLSHMIDAFQLTTTKQSQNYTVTFTATTGRAKQTVNFMLTVN